MTEKQLAEYNIGENLDQLMNLDPRGYGVCRILYPAARKLAGEPVSMHAAKKLVELLDNASGSTVYVLTGFILRPHLHPETDGITGAILLVRALITAFGVTPVIFCPSENIPAVRNSAPLIGMHVYDTIEEAQKVPLAFAVIPVSKNGAEAAAQTQKLLSGELPKLVFATEAPGANTQGEYHNAVGVNMTGLEAKMDGLFSGLQNKGVPAFAVGDLGNEIGMGAVASHILRYIPYAGDGSRASGCECSCKTGILASTKADYLVTATVSDWGVYAVIAAVAFLKKDISIMHDEVMEETVLRECSRSGMVDMTGSLLPAIDGFGVDMLKKLVALMRSTVEYAIGYAGSTWFKVTLEKQFYGQ
jgi:hypothetical protein